MENKFNLSEKIWLLHPADVIDVKHVKGFIKRIKNMFEERQSYEIIYRKIDELAGEKLISDERRLEDDEREL